MLARLEALQQRKQDQENFGRFSTISGDMPTGGTTAPLPQFQTVMPSPPTIPLGNSQISQPKPAEQQRPSVYRIPTGGTGAGQEVPVVWRGLPSGADPGLYGSSGTGGVTGAPSFQTAKPSTSTGIPNLSAINFPGIAKITSGWMPGGKEDEMDQVTINAIKQYGYPGQR